MSVELWAPSFKNHPVTNSNEAYGKTFSSYLVVNRITKSVLKTDFKPVLEMLISWMGVFICWLNQFPNAKMVQTRLIRTAGAITPDFRQTPPISSIKILILFFFSNVAAFKFCNSSGVPSFENREMNGNEPYVHVPWKFLSHLLAALR